VQPLKLLHVLENDQNFLKYMTSRTGAPTIFNHENKKWLKIQCMSADNFVTWESNLKFHGDRQRQLGDIVPQSATNKHLKPEI